MSGSKAACPVCAHPLLEGDIDVAKGRGVCRACGELISFASDQSATADAIKMKHRPIDLALEEAQEGTKFSFLIRGRTWKSVATLIGVMFFSLVFAPKFVWHYNASAPGNKLFVWLAVVVVLIGILRGLMHVLGYGEILLDAERLRSRVAFRRREVCEPTLQIESFSTNRETRAIGRGSEVTVHFVEAKTLDGRAIKLPVEMAEQSHAEYLATRLTAALATIRTPLTYRG